MDYADNRRDEMIEYVKQKYGEDKVAQIGTFGTMMARGAVRDVARALGLSIHYRRQNFKNDSDGLARHANDHRSCDGNSSGIKRSL